MSSDLQWPSGRVLVSKLQVSLYFQGTFSISTNNQQTCFSDKLGANRPTLNDRNDRGILSRIQAPLNARSHQLKPPPRVQPSLLKSPYLITFINSAIPAAQQVARYIVRMFLPNWIHQKDIQIYTMSHQATEIRTTAAQRKGPTRLCSAQALLKRCLQ